MKWVYMGMLALLAVVVGCESSGGRDDANASDTEPNAAAQRGTPIERIARERKWIADSALRKAGDLIEQGNRKLSQIRDKTFFHERKLNRVVAFVDHPSTGGESYVAAEIVLVEPDVRYAGGAFHSKVVVPEDAIVKQWTDRVAEAQRLDARLELGEVVEINRGDSLDSPFEVVVTARSVWSHRRGLAKDIQPIPTTPEGKRRWTEGAYDFYEQLRAPADGLLPSVSGEIRDPNSALQREAADAMKRTNPHSGEASIEMRLVYGLKENKWFLAGYSVSTEDPSNQGSEWGDEGWGDWTGERQKVDSVWPHFGGIPWATGLTKKARGVCRLEHVELPEGTAKP